MPECGLVTSMNWGGEREFAYGCLKCFWLGNFSDLFWNCVPDADGSRVT